MTRRAEDRFGDLGLGLLFAGFGVLILVFAGASFVSGKNPFLPAPAAVAAGLLGLLLLVLGAASAARGLARRK